MKTLGWIEAVMEWLVVVLLAGFLGVGVAALRAAAVTGDAMSFEYHDGKMVEVRR